MITPSFPLFGTDAAWWKMNSPTNRVIITALLRFDGQLERAALLATLERGIAPYPQFRSRIVMQRGMPHWEAIPDFDLSAHVESYHAATPTSVGALEEVVATFMDTPLPDDQPLWRLYLVEEGEGRTALIFRIHHAVGDGAALIHFLLSLTEGNRPGAIHTRRVAATAWYEPMRFALATLITPFALLLMPPEGKHPLRDSIQQAKRVAWSQPIPLDKIKAIGKASNSTVNDVLIAAVAGAFHPIVAAAGVQSVRAAIPVALRAFSETPKLENHIGLVFVALPVGTPHPLTRLEMVKKQMQALKRSPQAIVTFAVLWLAGYLPSLFAKALAWFLGTKITAVMTNVPGPQLPLTLAGVPIRQLMFWVPEAGNCGVGISLLSYNGTVTVGIAVDSGLALHPKELTSNFEAELEKFAPFIK